MRSVHSRLKRRVRHEAGQVLVWIVVGVVSFLALVGFVIDVGHVFNAHRELQASADAAALAGAQDLPDVSLATSRAMEYSSSAGKKNEHPDLAGVTTTVTPKCFSSTELPCNPANGIVVKESADVPTFFLKVIGVNSFSISAKSTASMKGGAAAAARRRDRARPHRLDVPAVHEDAERARRNSRLPQRHAADGRQDRPG